MKKIFIFIILIMIILTTGCEGETYSDENYLRIAGEIVDYYPSFRLTRINIDVDNDLESDYSVIVDENTEWGTSSVKFYESNFVEMKIEKETNHVEKVYDNVIVEKYKVQGIIFEKSKKYIKVNCDDGKVFKLNIIDKTKYVEGIQKTFYIGNRVEAKIGAIAEEEDYSVTDLLQVIKNY